MAVNRLGQQDIVSDAKAIFSLLSQDLRANTGAGSQHEPVTLSASVSNLFDITTGQELQTDASLARGDLFTVNASTEMDRLAHPGGAGWALTTDSDDVLWDQTPLWSGLAGFGAGLTILDDQPLNIGTDLDTVIVYDEAGDDRTEVTGADWLFDSLIVNIGTAAGDGGERLAVREDQDAVTAGEIVNASAEVAAAAFMRMKNTAGASGAAGAHELGVGVLGTGFTTSGIAFQDSAMIQAGGSLSGGLTIRTLGATPIVCGVNAGTEIWRVTTTAFTVNNNAIDIDFVVKSDTDADALVVQGSDSQITLGGLATGLVKATAGVLSIAIATDLPAHAAEHEVGGGDLVNHDSLTGFVADEHVAHSGVTLTAGAGLTGGGTIAANRTFDVGAGDGLTVNANDVALTTPGTLTVSTGNSAAGNHTHAVTSSANPGAAVSLLASNASGHLQLVKMGLNIAPAAQFTLTVDAVAGLAAIAATCSSGTAVSAAASTDGTGVSATSATGEGLIVNLSGAGNYIAQFRDGGNSVLTMQDGGNILFGPTATLDLNGIANALIFDAAGNLTLSAPTPGQLDIEIAGADDFTFTANSFNVLAGSDIVMANGTSIGQVAGPLLTFDDSNNFLEITGCKVGIGTVAPVDELSIEGDLNSGVTLGITNQRHEDTTGTVDIKAYGGYTATLDDNMGTIRFAKEQTWTSTASTRDGYVSLFTVLNGAQAERLRVISGGNVGIATTAPGQILDINAGSGNMIADGYDNHSLAAYKENITPVGAGLIDAFKAVPLYEWTRMPFVSTTELVALAAVEFGISNIEDARKYYAALSVGSPIRMWIDAKRDELREKRRELPKYQRKHLGLVADDVDTVAAIPDAISRDDDDKIVGYSLSNHVGFLHGVIRELVDRIEVLEQ